MHARPIPHQLRGQAIAANDADNWGVNAGRLRRDDVDRPFRGVRSFGLELESVHGRATALSTILTPEQAFSHVTALALHGVSLPSGHGKELHVAVGYPRPAPTLTGVRGHSQRRHDIGFVGGLPIVPPAMAWCQSAAMLSAEDLVVAGDQLVTGARSAGVRGSGLCTVTELRDELAEFVNTPGVGRARWAAERIRSGVDSPMETRLRLALLRNGLPEPVVDHPVPTAERVFHVDLAYPEFKVAIEYEGDEHRTDQLRFRRDISRRELLEAEGWRVIRVTIDDLRDPAVLAARIRRILTRRR